MVKVTENLSVKISEGVRLTRLALKMDNLMRIWCKTEVLFPNTFQTTVDLSLLLIQMIYCDVASIKG